jgi:hypothetical protein
MSKWAKLFSVVLVCMASLVGAGHTGEPKNIASAKKTNAARLKGMKDAIVDLEKGPIKQKDYNDRPDSPSWRAFVKLMTKDCGVTWETVRRDKVSQDEMEGYNDVMRVELEHRFGRGIIEKLEKKAEQTK